MLRNAVGVERYEGEGKFQGKKRYVILEVEWPLCLEKLIVLYLLYLIFIFS